MIKRNTVRQTAPFSMAILLLWSAQVGKGSDFSDPRDTHYTLKRAIAVALEHSPALQEAQLSLRIANGQVREAWSNVLPRLSTKASYSRSVIKQSFFFGDTLITIGADNLWGVGVTLSQPLFNMGAFIGLGAASRVRQLQTELLRGTTQQVISRVRQAYLTALLSTEEVQLTEKSLQRVRLSLEESRALNRSGMVGDYDVLRLEVQVSNLESDYHRARMDAATARRNLLVELGLSPKLDITLEGSLNDLDLQVAARNTPGNRVLLRHVGLSDGDPLQFQQVYEQALQDRSDLRQINISIALEEARLSAQRAEYFPTLSIFYNYNLTAQENGTLDFFGENPNQRTDFAVAGINVEVPLFTGFARNARMQQLRATVRRSEFRRQRQELEVESQLLTLLSNLADARLRAESHHRAVEQAGRGYEIATAHYRTGIGSQLQITDAEVALRQSEFNYSRTVFDYLTVRTRLEAAIGAVPVSVDELEGEGQYTYHDSSTQIRELVHR
ncbi:MAG: TolC family protein [Candidatus Marinimicrobia bacterium]|nr:TolC family protein [Candidatus Neomarinimicrobiota bacterium]